MADFRKYAPKLEVLEGGFCNRPNDRGGPTNRGVTLRTFRAKFGADKTIEDLKNMTTEQWTAIMKPEFWDKCKGDDIISQSVAEIFCDWCINSGIDKIRKVQFILGVKTDGIVGPKTLAALNGQDPENLFNRIKVARERFFRRIVELDPVQVENLTGWLNRLNSFRFTD